MTTTALNNLEKAHTLIGHLLDDLQAVSPSLINQEWLTLAACAQDRLAQALATGTPSPASEGTPAE